MLAPLPSVAPHPGRTYDGLALDREGDKMFKTAGGLLLVTLGAALALSVSDGRAVPGRKAPEAKTYRFTDKVVGAQISPTEAVFKVTDSRVGRGAGVQQVKLNGLKGTSKERTYYRGATATSRGSFTIGVPDPTGVAKLTGKGRDTSGTGKLAGSSATYTISGTFNVKTGIYKATLKGTGTIR